MKVLLSVQNISKSFGALALLNNASATISDGQRIGVCGRNGAGKSTLFKILVGADEPDSGSIIRSSGLRLAWLDQDSRFEGNETTLEYLERVSGAEEWRASQIAGSFFIPQDLQTMPAASLSGGFQMRARLAGLMLLEPDLLLMDEPTNYLDLSTQLLLEKFITSFSGSFLLISHDREFLMKTCNTTLEVEQGQLFLFPGNIEQYMAFKADQQARIIRQNENTEARRKELQNFVDRFRAKASKAAQAQSKLKQLERLTTIEVASAARSVRIAMPAVQIRKGSALLANGLTVGYSEKIVAGPFDLQISRGSHVAILADNGQGKSTLLKTLAHAIPALTGEFHWKEERIGYYAQHVYGRLDEKYTVEQALREMSHKDVLRQEILDLAGCFLFSGDDVKKTVGLLSGGERARLCLAGLLLAKSEVLLLDEPTNHLDFETVEALAVALCQYAGTLLFVSHDRTFVNLLASQILTIENGEVEFYPGSYSDYVFRSRMRLESGAAEPELKKSKIAKLTPAPEAPASEITPGRQRKEKKEELKQQRLKLKNLEKELQEMQIEQTRLTEELSGGEFSQERNDRLAFLVAAIPAAEEEWLSLGAEIESLRSSAG